MLWFMTKKQPTCIVKWTKLLKAQHTITLQIVHLMQGKSSGLFSLFIFFVVFELCKCHFLFSWSSSPFPNRSAKTKGKNSRPLKETPDRLGYVYLYFLSFFFCDIIMFTCKLFLCFCIILFCMSRTHRKYSILKTIKYPKSLHRILIIIFKY